MLFCILFLSYRWIFEDDRFTFGVAFWGYLALTGWVFRCGETPDQDISSESVDENPLYVYGMMRKNRKWFSGIRGCFLFQMLLLTDVFFAAVYSCWKCWTNSSGNDAIEKALLPLYILMTAGYVQFLKHSVRIHARSYRYIENKKEIWMPFSFICYKYEKLIDIKITFPEEVEERNVVFGKGLLHNQYQKKSEYELDEKGKVSFFKKNRNNQVNIWALIDITDMDRNDVLLLNDKFAEFWINEMSREEKKNDIRFTFVIQVDEINDYLQETFYESGGIFMDKHRSRLPVLYVRKHDILKVKWADNNSRYTNINKEMRKELKKIYDDSEIESINS